MKDQKQKKGLLLLGSPKTGGTKLVYHMRSAYEEVEVIEIRCAQNPHYLPWFRLINSKLIIVNEVPSIDAAIDTLKHFRHIFDFERKPLPSIIFICNRYNPTDPILSDSDIHNMFDLVEIQKPLTHSRRRIAV